MKNFLIYLLLLMSAVACSEVDPVIDDEDDKGAEVVKPDDEPDDMPEQDENDDDTQEAKTKLVASLMVDFYYDNDYDSIVTFEYDSNNRVVQGCWKFQYGMTYYSYQYDDSYNQMVGQYLDIEEETDTLAFTYYCTFDDVGLLRELVESNASYSSYFDYVDDKVSEQVMSFNKYTYKWQEGNLVGHRSEIVDYDNSEKYYDYDVEYGKVENKCNIDLYQFAELSTTSSITPFFDRNVFVEFFSKDFVIRANGDRIKYEFDEDGYPVKMIVYEDGEPYEEMTIEYYE